MTPDILVAGHIAKDITAEGWRPGGGVLYAAAQAQRLGLNVAAVTACSEDVDPSAILPGVEWRIVPSESTTTFENVYDGSERGQRLLAIAGPILQGDVPVTWQEAPTAFLTTLFHEIGPEVPHALVAPGRLLGLGAQGWLRRVEDGRVGALPFDVSPSWLTGDAVFVSEADVLDADRVHEWRHHVGVVVLTRGNKGCSVWDVTGRHDVTAAATTEVDPTGAGDVFAAAFLVRFAEAHDALEAARFAAAAAALSVEGEGTSAIAGRSDIEAMLREGRVKVA